MGEEMIEIRRDLATIRERVARLDGKMDAQAGEIARIAGHVETIFATLTAGQGAQDDRINALAVEQGERRGAAEHRQLWRSWLIPAGVAGAVGWLSRLLPHHP